MQLLIKIFIAFMFLAPQHSICEETIDNPEFIGTWKWIKVDDKSPPADFYMRAYKNGECASWPTPHKLVSRGKCSFKDGYFIIYRDNNRPAKAKATIIKKEMRLLTEDGVTMVYERLDNDLEPGKIP